MEVQRLRSGDSQIGVEAVHRLKAPDGYPTPPEEYFERFLSRPDNSALAERGAII